MYMLIPELSTYQPEPPIDLSNCHFIINQRTHIRFMNDERRWRICRTVQDLPEAIYLVVKPYRCPQNSTKFKLQSLAIPRVQFKILSECHQGLTYRDVSGISHTLLLTSKPPNRLSRCFVEEVFVA
jgi:hypothetical protein